MSLRALLVNAYSDSAKGRRKFSAFQSLVKQIFQQISYGRTVKPVELLVRPLHQLKELVDSPRVFDALDFVFVDGDPNLLPWMPECAALRTLIHMCLLSKKCLFACAPGMQVMGFESIVMNLTNEQRKNVERAVQMMDAREDRKLAEEEWWEVMHRQQRQDNEDNLQEPLRDFRCVGDRVSTIGTNAASSTFASSSISQQATILFPRLLAHDTGDVYVFQAEGNGMNDTEPDGSGRVKVQSAMSTTGSNWVRAANIGMCYHFFGPKQYRQLSEDSQAEITNPLCEHIVRIRNKHLSHPLFREVTRRDFVVPHTRHIWVLNPRGKSDHERGFAILADTVSATQIIEKDNAIGVQFHIDARHAAAVTLLKNYIHAKFAAMQEQGVLHVMLHRNVHLLASSLKQGAFSSEGYVKRVSTARTKLLAESTADLLANGDSSVLGVSASEAVLCAAPRSRRGSNASVTCLGHQRNASFSLKTTGAIGEGKRSTKLSDRPNQTGGTVLSERLQQRDQGGAAHNWFHLQAHTVPNSHASTAGSTSGSPLQQRRQLVFEDSKADIGLLMLPEETSEDKWQHDEKYLERRDSVRDVSGVKLTRLTSASSFKAAVTDLKCGNFERRPLHRHKPFVDRSMTRNATFTHFMAHEIIRIPRPVRRYRNEMIGSSFPLPNGMTAPFASSTEAMEGGLFPVRLNKKALSIRAQSATRMHTMDQNAIKEGELFQPQLSGTQRYSRPPSSLRPAWQAFLAEDMSSGQHRPTTGSSTASSWGGLLSRGSSAAASRATQQHHLGATLPLSGGSRPATGLSMHSSGSFPGVAIEDQTNELYRTPSPQSPTLAASPSPVMNLTPLQLLTNQEHPTESHAGHGGCESSNDADTSGTSSRLSIRVKPYVSHQLERLTLSQPRYLEPISYPQQPPPTIAISAP